MKSQICLFLIAIFQTLRSQVVPTIARIGQQCGGESLSPVSCEKGLTCIVPTTDPFVPDAPGICFKVVGAGEPCGVNSFTAPRCNSGLQCVKSYNASEDGSGFCKEVPIKLSGRGERCGDFQDDTLLCAPGLTCITNCKETCPEIANPPGICDSDPKKVRRADKKPRL